MNSPESSELSQAVALLKPYFKKALWFSLIVSLLVLAPTGFMLEVYGSVVTSRNHLTLAMLLLLVIGAYAVMELLDWARSSILHAAGMELDRKLADRIFEAIF